jgi:hypothetical protein
MFLALIVLALSVQVVLGARPVHEKFLEDETFEEELCGITVVTHVLVHGNVLIFEDHIVDLSQVSVTWTNDDGDWLKNFIAGPVMVSEEWNGDILTETARHMGVHQRMRSSEGIQPMTFDRGQIVFETVIDFTDLEEPVFVSADILFEAGPHPFANSQTDVFCEVVTDVLG